jgi:hypothetical protein
MDANNRVYLPRGHSERSRGIRWRNLQLTSRDVSTSLDMTDSIYGTASNLNLTFLIRAIRVIRGFLWGNEFA